MVFVRATHLQLQLIIRQLFLLQLQLLFQWFQLQIVIRLITQNATALATHTIAVIFKPIKRLKIFTIAVYKKLVLIFTVLMETKTVQLANLCRRNKKEKRVINMKQGEMNQTMETERNKIDEIIRKAVENV